jgi:hypothetical protein
MFSSSKRQQNVHRDWWINIWAWVKISLATSLVCVTMSTSGPDFRTSIACSRTKTRAGHIYFRKIHLTISISSLTPRKEASSLTERTREAVGRPIHMISRPEKIAGQAMDWIADGRVIPWRRSSVWMYSGKLISSRAHTGFG